MFPLSFPFSCCHILINFLGYFSHSVTSFRGHPCTITILTGPLLPWRDAPTWCNFCCLDEFAFLSPFFIQVSGGNDTMKTVTKTKDKKSHRA